MNKKKNCLPLKSKGFTLLETVVGMAIVGIVLLGLAQLFTLGVMNNMRSDRITNATFLAQQQVDFLRNLTAAELNTLAAQTLDELIDVNNDGTCDFRRITRVHSSGFYWDVNVLVLTAAYKGMNLADILPNSDNYKVKAQMSTIISR
jgi:prepilin-type N-terminal cleavage/methylation domain-containing protein